MLLNEKKQLTATNEQGFKLDVTLVAIDKDADLMLLDPMDMKFIRIADSVYKHQPIRTLTHGAGHTTYTTRGELLEDKEFDVGLFPILAPGDADKCPKDKFHSIKDVDGMFGPMPACTMQANQTISNAWTTGGSSGGAVVDNHGHLVGIESTGLGDGFSGFVKFSDIKSFLSSY